MKPGTRLRSTVCATEVIVVKAPATPVELECGGAPMITGDAEMGGGAADSARSEGTKLGKRYVDDEAGLEVLCTKAGTGSLSTGGAILPEKDTKPLPSSD